jgi:Transcriptional regulator containing an amidase domain and an AraC-type DNA-binding HTH domain
MQIPETTSAEGLEHYIHGTCRAASHGEAWRDIRASIFTAPSRGSVFTPAVSEPSLIWTTSGEVEVEERENKGPWIKSLIRKRSFFLIAGGAPYYCRWRTISREPFEYMLVLVGLPLLQRTGVSPLHYHINLRINAAQRLLRETKKALWMSRLK